MTWSAVYLTKVHGFAVMKMGLWASLYFVGGMLGAFLAGHVSDRVLKGRRKPMIVACFIFMIPFIIVLATLEKGVSPFIMLLTLTGAGFFSNMAWGPAISLPADMFPVESYGKAMGFVNCFAYIVAAASPYIMGWLITENPLTRAPNYFWAWIWVACTALIGVVAALLLVDKKAEKTAVAPAVV
jgi:sugar phosphate permease